MEAALAGRSGYVRNVARPLALALTAVTGAGALGHVLVHDGPLVDAIAVTVTTLLSATIGALVAMRRPSNPCGWLLAGAASIGQLGITTQSFAQTSIAAGADSAIVTASAWLATWLSIPPGILLVIMLLRFPSGGLPSVRWRFVEVLALIALVLTPASTALRPGRLEATPSLHNPLGIEPLRDAIAVVENLGQTSIALTALASVASLFFRYRKAGTEQREQLKWVAFAVSVLMVGVISAVTVETAGALNEASFFLMILGVCAIPISIGIAILRHRLFDIDLLISRTIVYFLMTAGVVGFYVALVGTLTGVIGRRVDLTASLVATAVVAIAFAPVREGLQRQVNRLIFGRRDDPYAVVTGLGRLLEQTASPGSVLPTAAHDIADSLRLPYVGISLLEDGAAKTVAEHGTRSRAERDFPLIHHGEAVGVLTVAPRSGSVALDEQDEAVITDLARHLGPAAHAVRLTEALRASRAEIIQARESERRRLRRDLHDSHGAQLAGIALGISAAQDLMSEDPREAERQLTKVEAQLRDAISGIRALVAGLVPPELERLGLWRALQERATVLSSADLEVTVSGSLPEEVGAATESAAYRIAIEALTNALRHSGARRCTVALHADGDLHLEVTDDGCGIPEDAPMGTGLVSMRERAEEIGGTLRVEPMTPSGTRVVARLPVTS